MKNRGVVYYLEGMTGVNKKINLQCPFANTRIHKVQGTSQDETNLSTRNLRKPKQGTRQRERQNKLRSRE